LGGDSEKPAAAVEPFPTNRGTGTTAAAGTLLLTNYSAS
jgi:hypothetical protein